MKYDRLYNFISPVTGKLPIDKGYTLLGDKNGKSFASPVLIDVRQDIIDLRRSILNKLDYKKIWIGNYYNKPEEKLHIEVINLPPLSEAVFPNPLSPIIGDFRIPNPTYNYLSPFDLVMSGPYLPQIYATKYDTLGNPIGTDISSSLAMTQVRAAQIMKRFDNANFIVGSSVVNFAWENQKMYFIPEPLKQLYGLGTTYTFTKAQSLGALDTGLLKNTVNNGLGILSKASGGKSIISDDYVDPLSLQEEITETKQYAAAKAEEARVSAISYFTTQMAPFVPTAIPFTGIGFQISAGITSATALAADAKNTADDAKEKAVLANKRIDEFRLLDDVTGVVTKFIDEDDKEIDVIHASFTPNPRFTGKEYIKIPFGNTLERPVIPEQGMVRYNVEL